MDFFETLVRYETRLWNHFDRIVKEAGLPSLANIGALRVVRAHAGNCRVNELRSEIGITVGAASKLVDRLERDGLVVRSPHPEDRRSSVISLTEAGTVAVERGEEVVAEALAEHLRGAPEIPAVQEVLTRLMGSIESTNEEVVR